MRRFQAFVVLLLAACLPELDGFSLVAQHADKITTNLPPCWKTKSTSFVWSDKEIPKQRFHRKHDQTQDITFSYDCNVLEVGSDDAIKQSNTIGVMLIHPIGVGIGKWFYERLLRSLQHVQSSHRLVILAPDLIGSGSASNPMNPDNSTFNRKIPLYNISDWTLQLDLLMAETEQEYGLDSWCILANGGCSPIALQVAQRSVQNTAQFEKNVSNVILSSLPRLPFFLTASNPLKVAKSYKTLCGPIGNIFWWYACRKEGAFIQKFSEKNLVADPANLGDDWRPNCFQTARANNGKSRYSTFAFLAGVLQDGCVESLEALKESKNVAIHCIKGRDTRRNQAKSYFWQRSKRKRSSNETNISTLRDYLKEHSIEGGERVIGGRISLAHEDSKGYADAITAFLQD